LLTRRRIPSCAAKHSIVTRSSAPGSSIPGEPMAGRAEGRRTRKVHTRSRIAFLNPKFELNALTAQDRTARRKSSLAAHKEVVRSKQRRSLRPPSMQFTGGGSQGPNLVLCIGMSVCQGCRQGSVPAGTGNITRDSASGMIWGRPWRRRGSFCGKNPEIGSSDSASPGKRCEPSNGTRKRTRPTQMRTRIAVLSP
jgi:hypothetical protein